jgi:hypothetical protein
MPRGRVPRAVQPRRPWRRPTQVTPRHLPAEVLVGVVLVVVALVVWLGLVLSSGGPGEPVHGSPLGSVGKAATDVSNRLDTERALRALLDEAPALPGAVPVAAAPADTLREPLLGISSPNRLEATRFWTAPGGVADAVAYLAAHRPAGFSEGSSGGTATDRSRTGLSWVTFERDDADVAHDATSLELVVARLGPGQVGVRADAMGAWRPARDPSLHIDPSSVTGAEVRLSGPPSHPTRPASVRVGRLEAPAARRVATLLDAQLPAVPMVASCPMQQGATQDVVVLHTTTGEVVVDVELSCLGSVTVSRDGTRLGSPLEGAHELDRVVRAAVTGEPRLGEVGAPLH